MDLNQLAGAFGGTAAGGALMVWFAKRLITKYDEQHRSHASDHKEVMTALGLINTKLAAVEVRAAEVVSIREHIRAVDKELAVVRSFGEKTREDVNVAHERLRTRGKGE